MDRLLSELEIYNLLPDFYAHTREEHREMIDNLISSQLLKADKEWVEWIEKLPYEQFDNEGFPTEIDSRASHRCYLIGHNTLQERKREIGI